MIKIKKEFFGPSDALVLPRGLRIDTQIDIVRLYEAATHGRDALRRIQRGSQFTAESEARVAADRIDCIFKSMEIENKDIPKPEPAEIIHNIQEHNEEILRVLKICAEPYTHTGNKSQFAAALLKKLDY